jgi:hypothetical protein
MTTIIIAEGITATLTNRKAEQYRKAMEATESARTALQMEDFDWEDYEDFWAEEWEAWERFFS